MKLLLGRLGWEDLNKLGGDKRKGRPQYILSRAQLLSALIFHYTVTWAGTFSEHLLILMGMKIAESTLSERRQALPFEIFEQLLARVLRPLTSASAQAFHQGLRLVAIDGIGFSLPNNQKIKKRCQKGNNGHGPVAFAKLQCAALVELVMHNPLAARLGINGESEWKLALGLLVHLPKLCLLLCDRLYGCGAFIIPAARHLKSLGGHLLARVKENLKVVHVKRLKDGTRIVEIKLMDPENKSRVLETMKVREIRATLQRRGHRDVHIRLLTTLMDCDKFPARELIALYASRWEQELYFRELKRELAINDLLRSQTVETAAQEVAAMIIGSSLIAQERASLKPGEELCHRISFIKVWETLEPLWLTLMLGADILSEEQKQQLTDRFYWLASTRKMAKKRVRACPRVLRQPNQPWPRKKDQQNSTAPLEITICASTEK